MKASSAKPKRAGSNPRAAKILKSLRNARKQALEKARQHRTAIVYLEDGKVVRERP